MAKLKPLIARNVDELVALIGLPPEAAPEFELRHQAQGKLSEVMRARKLTVAQVAKRAGTSRVHIQTLLDGAAGTNSLKLLWVLRGPGYGAKLTFTPRKQRGPK